MSIEVCGSDYRELPPDKDALLQKVKEELVSMGMLESLDSITFYLIVATCPMDR